MLPNMNKLMHDIKVNIDSVTIFQIDRVNNEMPIRTVHTHIPDERREFNSQIA